MDVYLTNNNWTGCQYVQAQAHRRLKNGTWTKASKWKWMPVDEVVEFSRRNKNILTFCSIGHFDKADKMSKQISNLCFDFDCGDDGEFALARNSCLEIIDYLGDLGLEKEHIRVWFTGGRGYHIEVPHQVFDALSTNILDIFVKQHLGKNRS